MLGREHFLSVIAVWTLPNRIRSGYNRSGSGFILPQCSQAFRYNYGAPLSTILCDGMSVRCWVVGAMFPPSIFEDRYVDLRRSMVDLRRSMIDVPTFEDRWSLCRPSKTDDRCEIILLHLLKTLIIYLYSNCAEGLYFSQCFHYMGRDLQ